VIASELWLGKYSPSILPALHLVMVLHVHACSESADYKLAGVHIHAYVM
jgi:hypothetical protein